MRKLSNKEAIQKAFISGISIHLSCKECDNNLSLISRAIDSIKEDDEYGHLIEAEDAMEYITNLSNRLYDRLGNISLYDININEVEICSECGKVLLPNDECYESHNGIPLCGACSYRCECCDEYFTKSEVVGSANGYCCSECEKSSEYEPEHTQMVEIKDHAVDLAGMMLDVPAITIGDDKATSKIEYLLSLNPIVGSDKIWLPEIGENELVELRKNNNPVYIAHDWFSQGAYEYGLFTIMDSHITELQRHPNARIVNCGGNYIFELGTMDHKGLIAIEIPKDFSLPVFIMNRGWDHECNKEKISLWFEPKTLDNEREKIVNMVKTEDSVIYIHEAMISIYAEDYDRMLQQLPVQLI